MNIFWHEDKIIRQNRASPQTSKKNRKNYRDFRRATTLAFGLLFFARFSFARPKEKPPLPLTKQSYLFFLNQTKKPSYFLRFFFSLSDTPFFFFSILSFAYWVALQKQKKNCSSFLLPPEANPPSFSIFFMTIYSHVWKAWLHEMAWSRGSSWCCSWA